MDNYELPSQWAKRMMDKAKDGNESMAYFELMNLWKEREDKKSTISKLNDEYEGI